jgi:hypothetical protein
MKCAHDFVAWLGLLGLTLAAACNATPSGNGPAASPPAVARSAPAAGVRDGRRPSGTRPVGRGGGDVGEPATGAGALGTPSPRAQPSAAAPPSRCPQGRHCDYQALERTPRPKVTEVLIEQGPHRLHLLAGDTVVKSYRVALGQGGLGAKQYEGDAKTPIGTYKISGRLPTSPWHVFLAVSYPNLDDWHHYAKLKAEQRVPVWAGIGFGIGIHGRGKGMRDGDHKEQDWTLGCIALDNPEIEEVAALVPNGTTVVITD